MTTNREKVRGQIVTICLPEWDNEDACRCEDCLRKANKRADQILSDPSICIKAEDQSDKEWRNIIKQEKICPLSEEQNCPYEPLLLSCDDCYANRILILIKEAHWVRIEEG